MRVGLLTGGGDCPGLNAVIHAVVKKGIFHYGMNLLAFLKAGAACSTTPLCRLRLNPLTAFSIRVAQFFVPRAQMSVRSRAALRSALPRSKRPIRSDSPRIALGGDDYLSTGTECPGKGRSSGCGRSQDHRQRPVWHRCPGSVLTLRCLLRPNPLTPAHHGRAHNRVIVCEVMGRDAVGIALTAGVAGGAHVVRYLKSRLTSTTFASCSVHHDHGKKYGIVVVAEGAKLPSGDQAVLGAKVDSFGHARLSGVGQALSELIEGKDGIRNPLGQPGTHAAWGHSDGI